MNRRFVAVGLVAALVSAGCASDNSVLVAGNEDTSSTATSEWSTLSTDDAPATTMLATTTTTPLASLAPCPVDALDNAAGPTEITFWHGLNADNEVALDEITAQYNASQDRVIVDAQNQGGYGETIDKFFQSSSDNRPDMVMFPEYMVRQTADSESVIPAGACVAADSYDTSKFQPSTLIAYTADGVQWGMPFNVSNPVLYYNRRAFEAAGLDPDAPPRTLQELRDYSQQIVDTGAATYGISIDTGSDSGGGWFIEQWFANAGELYADNGNGRLAPATRVLYDGPAGVELLKFVQDLVVDGLAFNVGDNASGTDNFLKIADPAAPSAMTIGTSAALGTVINVLDGGLIPGLVGDDIGVGPLPGPGETPTALVGGASLYVVAGHNDVKAAAAWDFIKYLLSPEVQSKWAALTGYVPVRFDALTVEPLLTVYVSDPRFRVAYDQLVNSPDDVALQGPILGPQREVRSVTARAVAEILAGGDVQAALSAAAAQANALIADYNLRN